METSWWVWIAFSSVIVALLSLDLLVFHRDPHEVSFREAALTSAFWVTLGLAFGGLVWWWMGGRAAGEYLAGFLIEKSLAVDNIFVFALIFSFFGVPARHQHRVLFWGVVGALVFRAAFIGAGAVLLARFHWTIYVFGGFLLLTGVRMARSSGHEVRPDRNPVLRAFRRLVPMTEGFAGRRFVVRRAGRVLATPMLAVLVVIETSDVLFAVDSIPAIFAVTDDPFLVFTSNAFAILGLRALYFLLAGMMERFVHLKVGLALVLMLVGTKMILTDVLHVPVWASLLAIGLIVGGSVWTSLRATRGAGAPSGADRDQTERVWT